VLPYQQRLDRLIAAMEDWGVDILFLNYGPDYSYVTGVLPPMYYHILKGRGDWVTGMLVSRDKEPMLLFQRSFAVDVQTWIADVRVLGDDEDPQQFLANALASFEPEGRTIAVSKMLWGQTLLALQRAAPEASFVPATNEMMDRLRSVKDAQELELMQRAATITDRALEATVRELRMGMTERDVANEVVHQIRRCGGDGFSFYPGIICVGNGSDPARQIMTRNTEMKLAPGTTVAFDFGVLHRGYCSDFGRTVFIGEPRSDALAAYRSITTVAIDTMSMMQHGRTTPAQVAEHARRRVADDGFAEWYFRYGLGHAIGLEVHEWPWLREGFDEPIRKGMCFTIEPKEWKPGEFYVRCEDVVVVEEERARSLTRFHCDPIVVER
jgi:Xaa-Pro aminopeptidase